MIFRQLILKSTLACDARAKTVLNGDYSGLDVVKSPHIEHMLDVYSIASTGRISVVRVESQLCVHLRTVGRLRLPNF
jgi:hypothetical protein